MSRVSTPQIALGGYDDTSSGTLEQALAKANANKQQASTNQVQAWGDGAYGGSEGGTYNGVGRAAAADAEGLYSQQAGDLRNQALYDPWGFYRGGAAKNLASFAGGADPSDIFRSKLTQMTTGQFSPDDPSYKWRLDQGQQAVERSLGARGLLNSGNAAIELQQYGQGAASQEYGAQFNRLLQGMTGVESQYNSQFSRLAQLAGISLDPGTGGKINAGIQQAQIGANAQVASAAIGQSASLARVGLDSQINQQNQANYAAYNQGLGNVLSGKDWQGGA